LQAQAPFHLERHLQIRTALAGKFRSPLTKNLAFEHSCCPLSSVLCLLSSGQRTEELAPLLAERKARMKTEAPNTVIARNEAIQSAFQVASAFQETGINHGGARTWRKCVFFSDRKEGVSRK
ncbi:MAG: hypothetical protein LBF93_05210, partial [Zoogloeaceae bacterium]|nr:hypothetical protein [Zoogloeaceae bacterium]